jgi:hypothetical protein
MHYTTITPAQQLKIFAPEGTTPQFSGLKPCKKAVFGPELRKMHRQKKPENLRVLTVVRRPAGHDQEMALLRRPPFVTGL